MEDIQERKMFCGAKKSGVEVVHVNLNCLDQNMNGSGLITPPCFTPCITAQIENCPDKFWNVA